MSTHPSAHEVSALTPWLPLAVPCYGCAGYLDSAGYFHHEPGCVVPGMSVEEMREWLSRRGQQ